jgi:hypothetical protein
MVFVKVSSRCFQGQGVQNPTHALSDSHGGLKVDNLCLYDCRPDATVRPPAWRWLLATWTVEHGKLPWHPDDDRWLRRAVRFLRALRRGRAATRRRRRARRRPAALRQAWQLYTAPPAFQRWELEARLLTDESFEEIGSKCGLAARVVEFYHEVFFHVRDRLEARGYIHSHVIGVKQYLGLTEDDVDVLLKLFAYSGGPLLLDRVVRYFRAPPQVPQDLDTLDLAALRELQGGLRLRTRIAFLAVPFPVSEAAQQRGRALVQVGELLLEPAPPEVEEVAYLRATLRVVARALDWLAPPPAAAAGRAAEAPAGQQAAGRSSSPVALGNDGRPPAAPSGVSDLGG